MAHVHQWTIAVARKSTTTAADLDGQLRSVTVAQLATSSAVFSTETNHPNGLLWWRNSHSGYCPLMDTGSKIVIRNCPKIAMLRTHLLLFMRGKLSNSAGTRDNVWACLIHFLFVARFIGIGASFTSGLSSSILTIRQCFVL